MYSRFIKRHPIKLAVFFIILILVYWTLLRECKSTSAKDRTVPLIFIGGVPRSGTTLMRAILDAHPLIRCGEETIVIPLILGILSKAHRDMRRYKEAKISEKLINEAVGDFILKIIVGHGASSKHLCNKDPFTLRYIDDLHKLFPNAKFILMIRDGRAVVNSIITRHVTITSFNLSDYEQCLRRWNQLMDIMWAKCNSLGGSFCHAVYYEQLVLHPQTEIKKVLNFLSIPWNEAVMKHHEFVGSEISISKLERSSDQIIMPINLEPLTRWVDSFPRYLREQIEEVAPMLRRLGYDPNAYPPYYGKPDLHVENNTVEIKINSKYWQKKVKDFLND